jgi:hypothetical protein
MILHAAEEGIAWRKQLREDARYDWLLDGFALISAHNVLDAGEFGPWRDAKTGLSERTAENYMSAARLLAPDIGPENFSAVHPRIRSVVFLLAQSTTPEEIRATYRPRVISGDRVPIADVRAAIETWKPAETEAVDVEDEHQLDTSGPENFSGQETAADVDAISDPFDDVFDSLGLDAKPAATENTRPAVDLTTFDKVRALHDSTTSPGEKEAAAGRMKALANSVGLTVEQAIAELDKTKPVAPLSPNLTDFFRDMMNTPEHRAWEEQREQKRAARRAVALAEYGSEDAVWEPCERERALEDACRRYIVRRPIINGEMDTLQGWDGGGWARLTSEVQAAIADVYAMPETVGATWEEFLYWEKRIEDQCAFSPYVEHPLCVRARVAFLEDRLDTLPACSVSDLKARVSWLQFEVERGFVASQETNRLRLDTLSGDIARMGDKLREAEARLHDLSELVRSAELRALDPIEPDEAIPWPRSDDEPKREEVGSADYPF